VQPKLERIQACLCAASMQITPKLVRQVHIYRCESQLPHRYHKGSQQAQTPNSPRTCSDPACDAHSAACSSHSTHRVRHPRVSWGITQRVACVCELPADDGGGYGSELQLLIVIPWGCLNECVVTYAACC
jgi:hypothetical protein